MIITENLYLRMLKDWKSGYNMQVITQRYNLAWYQVAVLTRECKNRRHWLVSYKLNVFFAGVSTMCFILLPANLEFATALVLMITVVTWVLKALFISYVKNSIQVESSQSVDAIKRHKDRAN